MKKTIFYFFLMVFVAGCGESSPESLDSFDTGILNDMFTNIDILKGDLKIDIPSDFGSQNNEDQFEIIEGGFLWKCSSNSDCISGWCIPSANGMVCTKTCSETCPDGWLCKGVASEGTDLMYICVPLFPTLCNPCKSHQDCSTMFSAEGNFCIDYKSDGKFCGGNCENYKCPEGYECKEVFVDNKPVKQCVPLSGKCECSDYAKQMGYETTCFFQNEFGKCEGVRKCTLSGLSECDAKIPEQEVCNGKDDNCDGLTDNFDEPQKCKKTNEFGTCWGELECNNGTPNCKAPEPEKEKCDGIDNNCDGKTDEGFDDTDGDGIADCVDEDIDNDSVLNELDNCPYVKNSDQKDLDGDKIGDACDDDKDGDGVLNDKDCEPENGKISQQNPEVCDGIDNNCNGETDEGLCDDKNPCTKDICQPDGGCIHENLTGPCDDNNVCTVGDVCNNGQCIGSSTIDCNDNNPCTIDKCHPISGCYWEKAPDGTPCSTGNLCSTGDKCIDGICKPGQPVDCDDDNECTKDYCDPQTGCGHTVMIGAPCTYEFAICDIPGTCGANGCVPTENCNKCGPTCKLCVCCDPFLYFCLIE